MRTIDMHCDTVMKLCIDSQKGIESNLKENEFHIDLKKMKKGDYLAQCFAMFVPFSVENPFETCMDMIERYYQEIENNNDLILPAYNYQDIIENKRKGKMSSILTIEEGGVVKGKLSNLRLFHRLGVRMITLTWNYENGIGHPNFTYVKGEKPDFKTPNKKDGLTPFGIEMIKEMNRLGIIIDVSHLSDAGFYDVVKYSKGPFVASHSNARSVCNHVRNLTDDMIRKLALRGGVMGINFCADFLHEKIENVPNFSRVSYIVEHIKHIVKIGGIDCVGLGTDFDGIEKDLEIKDASFMPMLRKTLLDEGFSEEDVDKIFYKNFLRVFKEVTK
ncbi:MAG: dipeptidase [Bacilli bacterium]|nr:dipeptidase [Bacilli bacterium]